MSGTTAKVARPVRLLAENGMAALMPKLKNGKYFAPLVSRRKAAVVRKNAIIEGTFGNFDAKLGGWDPAWDTPKKFHFVKPSKGHQRERTRPQRAAVITKAMNGMPARLDKLKADNLARRPKQDFSFMLKRIAGMANPLTQKPMHYMKKADPKKKK